NNRNPQPYKSLATRAYGSSSCPSTRSTSSRDKTTGIYGRRLARTAPSTFPNSFSRTCLNKNNKALNAWFWLDAATCRSTARKLKNPLTSSSATTWGSLLLVNVCNFRVHALYACHVLGE